MRLLLPIPLALALACGASSETPASSVRGSSAPASEASADRPASCPAQAPAPEPLPHVTPAHRTLAHWLERAEEEGLDLDAELLTPAEIAAQNAAHLVGEDPARQPALHQPLGAEKLREQLEERLAYLRERFESEAYVDAEGEPVEDLSAFEVPAGFAPAPRLHVALAPIPLRCAPRAAPFYTPSRDLAFDRNNCSTLRAQEPLELLGEWPGGMVLARSRYALGWLAPDAPLSPAVPAASRDAVLIAPRLRTGAEATFRAGEARVTLPAGALVAPAPEGEGDALLATEGGLVPATTDAELVPTQRPLTRRAVLEEAFALLDAPYGWGGHDGGRDCSRFLLDVFATFGLELPRHSARQAQAGTFAIDVEAIPSAEKQLLIDTALKKGVVLLHFPGHIMLYLGRDAGGRPYAIHSFSEYVEPCDAEGDEGDPLETVRRVDRVAVSDLSLGEGSSRDDFLARVTQVVVLGGTPGPELRGAASLRPVAPVTKPADDAPCDDALDRAVFRSPYRPFPGQPLRVIVTASDDPGPVELALFDPRGERVEAAVHETGGPPWGWWAEVSEPRAGRWTAVLGDGSRHVACERFTVVRYAPEHEPRRAETPAWVPSWRWEEDTENLFATFVEQLFREPTDEEVTWSNLQELLRDPARNILHDHRMLEEDGRLDLEPDCADLPYFLRAYFAWKLRLPMAWRQCRRGRAGRPPRCGDTPNTNLMPVTASDDVAAFEDLIRTLKRNVHSSSNRTLPGDDMTDVYPVPLTREALRPGTVFADPYGHILVVAAWLPQTLDGYGVLVGADAQPDGTVGRRRFWRGSFLFTPDTDDAGAGFKAWRPVVYDRGEQSIAVLTNEELRRSDEHVPFSDMQYRGSLDDFYDRMEGLINPRPLDPRSTQVALVDALEESVTRRVVSVSNGEEFMASRGFRPIEMPEGAAIFQTEGPWEDFSTPSRDLRLLISIDAVIGFPDKVERNPERFGLDEAGVGEAVAELRALLDRELAARRFTYARSDGSEWELTLKDVVDRREAMEMAYNPNDCVEIRWAAPEGSDERSTCRRHASSAHRRRMAEYRPWFETRQRPAR